MYRWPVAADSPAPGAHPHPHTATGPPAPASAHRTAPGAPIGRSAPKVYHNGRRCPQSGLPAALSSLEANFRMSSFAKRTEVTCALGERLFALYELTKPRVLLLVLFTAFTTLLMVNEPPPPGIFAALLFGIALAAAAAGVLNMYVERERDKLMERTRLRPLPSGRLHPRAALAFGALLAVVSTALLLWVGGAVAALISAASILFYVFVYTIWLKPRTPQSALVGGAAGAAAPLIADAAVNGTVGLPGLVLFAIVFLWQPPHVYAIALFRREEYAHAGIPVLPLVAGRRRTCYQMLFYSALLVPFSLAPTLLGWVGIGYGIVALLLGAWFIESQWRLLKRGGEADARRVFVVSLAYLFLLYAALIIDRLVSRGTSPELW